MSNRLMQVFEYKNDSKAAIKKLRQLCKEKETKKVGVRMTTEFLSSVNIHIPIKYACNYINKVASEVDEYRTWEWVESADLKVSISATEYFVYVRAMCDSTRISKDEEE